MTRNSNKETGRVIEVTLSDGTTGSFGSGDEAFEFCIKNRPHWEFNPTNASGQPIMDLATWMEKNADRRKKFEVRKAPKL